MERCLESVILTPAKTERYAGGGITIRWPEAVNA